MIVRRMKEIKPFVTKDKSLIYEFLHPIYDETGVTPKELPYSLALAIVKPNDKTIKHIHETSTEIYYIVKGRGFITLDKKTEQLEENMMIFIPPELEHTVKNTGEEDLMILCFSMTLYKHEDTKLLE